MAHAIPWVGVGTPDEAMVLILSHGQVAVERGFSVNGKLLIDNLHTESLTAQRLVYDLMKCHSLEPFTIPITAALLSHVKRARKRYFESQEERAKKRIKSTREETIEEIGKEISSINQQSVALNKTIEELKVTLYKYSFDAEKRNDVAEIKSDIAKSNALKRAASDKQAELDGILVKKKMLIKKKEEL